jgi:hypothetical protein
MAEKSMSQEGLEKFLVQYLPTQDEFIGFPVTYNAGAFGEMTAWIPAAGIEGKNCWGWAVIGGSSLVHCREREKNIMVAYVMNSFSTTMYLHRAGKLVRKVLDAIEGH